MGDPMNLVSLEKALQQAGAPARSYSLRGGLPTEAYCIDQDTNSKWIVYYSERGKEIF